MSAFVSTYPTARKRHACNYLVGPDKRPTGVPTPGVYTLRLHFTELNPPASSERTPS